MTGPPATGDAATLRRVSQPTADGGRRRVVISAFDHPQYQGGGQQVTEMIASKLASHFDVTVVTTSRLAATVIRDGVRYRTLPLNWAGPRAGQLLFHAWLPVLARLTRHDLWIESFTPPFSTSFLPLFSRGRVLGLAQTLSGEEMSVRYRLPFFRLERFGLRFYTDIVVLNHADSEQVRRHSPAAVQVIPNGVQTPQLADSALGLGDHILFLGRIDIWEKGLDLLCEAYGRSHPDLPLLVAGSGARRHEQKLAALVTAHGGAIRWVGHVTGERKRELLQRSAFVVLPSRQETFGLTALEGMSFGKPVIHFDLPALRWMEGDVRVPPFDVIALAREIHHLAGDEAARRELGRTAYHAAQRYGIDQTADRYFALVQQLLGETDPGQ
ncbi:MAG TPA: glycosyltransferase family 4 protein [Streptosporangiaceae bacterium]|nr:glycosyltransferase family 4 protein [Streptosporangiaceae bacterium]